MKSSIILIEILTHCHVVNFGFRDVIKRTKMTLKNSVYSNLLLKVGVII